MPTPRMSPRPTSFNKMPSTAQILGDQIEDAHVLRVQAMDMATQFGPQDYDDEGPSGQVETDWSDVMQYWRGVGGSALRRVGVQQGNVRKLGLM